MSNEKYKPRLWHPWKAEKDSVCPVPKGTRGTVLRVNDNLDTVGRNVGKDLSDFDFTDQTRNPIIAFIVTKYPAHYELGEVFQKVYGGTPFVRPGGVVLDEDGNEFDPYKDSEQLLTCIEWICATEFMIFIDDGYWFVKNDYHSYHKEELCDVVIEAIMDQ